MNPSLAYCVNRFNYVLAYSVFNDGLDILDKLNINHTNINNAVEKTILLLLEAGYLKDNQPAGMVITAAGKADEKAGVLTESLKETINETTDANRLDIELVAACVTQEYVGQAEEAGVSPGKMLLIDELLKTSARATAQDPKRWYGESVQEIMQRIKEIKKSKENEDGKQTESNENVSDDVINNSGSVNTASNEESRRNKNQNNGRGNAGANANANAGKKVNNNANPNANANKNANSSANSNSNLNANTNANAHANANNNAKDNASANVNASPDANANANARANANNNAKVNANANANANASLNKNANATKNNGSDNALPDTQDGADKLKPDSSAGEGTIICTNTIPTDELGTETEDKLKDKNMNKDNKDSKDSKDNKKEEKRK